LGSGTKRNKKCDCGSGLKYKNCHGKPNQEPIKLYELEKELKDSYTKKVCMSPKEFHKECTKKIIKAHTISKSSNLKKIAKDGHVYSFKQSIQELDKDNGIFPIEKIGVNNASVFNGFCSKHDKELFSDIEDKEIIFSDKQILLLAYRAISNELYLKYSSLNHNSKLSKHKPKIPMEMIGIYDNYINFMKDGTKLAIRDLEYIKKYYDSSLINSDFENQMNYYILILDKVPEIVNNAGWIPTIDFNNNDLSDLNKKDIKYNTLTVNTIVYKDKGAIVFAWHKELNCIDCVKFIQSLHNINNKNKGIAILKWLFECSENIFWSIEWWDNLDKSIKQILIDNMMNITRKQNLSNFSILDKALDWNIIDIKTNLNI
jgi:uncharacterized short protein YbdD (DUF466 family)